MTTDDSKAKTTGNNLTESEVQEQNDLLQRLEASGDYERLVLAFAYFGAVLAAVISSSALDRFRVLLLTYAVSGRTW